MISALFTFLSSIVSIYSVICLIYIVMTWIPGLKFTSFGKIVSSITEPYMNFFSSKGWLRFGNIDFSPILSIGLLSILSNLFSTVAQTHNIFSGLISAVLIGPLSIVSSLLGLFFLVIFIRWIVLKINHGQTSYNSAWNQFDDVINRVTYKISRLFTKKYISYEKSLMYTWIAIIISIILISVITHFAARLIYYISALQYKGLK